MKQKYGVTVGSSEINFYASDDMMDKIFSESFDDAFRKIESHDKLVKALEQCLKRLPTAYSDTHIKRDAIEALAAAKGE